MARIWTGNDSVENEPARQVESASFVNLGAMVELLAANGFMKGLAADQKVALKVAVVQRDEETLKLLFAANFDVDAFMVKVEEDFRRWRCPNMPNPLQAAAKEGHMSILRLLIDRGADVNNQGCSITGGPALYEASLAGHLEAVQLLLRFGADPNTRAHLHGTALKIALEKGNGLIVQSLLNSGAMKDVVDEFQSRLGYVQKGIRTFPRMSPYSLPRLYSRDNRCWWRLAYRQISKLSRRDRLSNSTWSINHQTSNLRIR